ncbi:DUF4275 family protein [Lysinibacillus sp. 3P01SB]|uniref:DUF4275 family protein n=1 Tax=Lysinibacillus sp. 3P01SB TaxID=3132284 RepID=UPI0039A5EA29
MEFRKELQVIESPVSAEALRKIWEKIFTVSLSTKEKERIFLDQFLWHICSWGAVSCAAKEEAIALFTNQEKDKCTIFYQFIDDAYMVKNAKELTVHDVPYEARNMNRNDIYVMDDKLKWTFIMTHEEQCGPYFIKI